jgi:hypothetical protein
MIGNNAESSWIVQNSNVVPSLLDRTRQKKTKRKQNRHFTVWDRRGERDKRLPENFVKILISGTEVRPGQKYAGRC